MSIGTTVDQTVSKLEGQLKQWSSKLSELVAKGEAAGQQAKVDLRKQYNELKAKLEVAQKKLDQAKAAGGDKWDTFKQGVESSWSELEAAFKRLVH